eukprot:XP_011679355.1 PREDICTED: putative uncharacterized protein ENSP00000383309 [Strongylocentrotus purpuratus]
MVQRHGNQTEDGERKCLEDRVWNGWKEQVVYSPFTSVASSDCENFELTELKRQLQELFERQPTKLIWDKRGGEKVAFLLDFVREAPKVEVQSLQKEGTWGNYKDSSQPPPTSPLPETPSLAKDTQTPPTSPLPETPSLAKDNQTPPTSPLPETQSLAKDTQTPPTSPLPETPFLAKDTQTPPTSPLPETPSLAKDTQTPPTSPLPETQSLAKDTQTPPTSPLPETQSLAKDTQTPPTSPLPETPSLAKDTQTPPTSPLPETLSPAKDTQTPPTSPLLEIPPHHDDDGISINTNPVDGWYEYTNDTGTQTSDPEDHIGKLMDRCRISIKQNPDSKRTEACSETQSYFHTLKSRESVARVFETLHLPGGGFYTRFEYKVRKF